MLAQFLDGSAPPDIAIKPEISVKIISALSSETAVLVHTTHFGQSVFASWNSVYPVLELALVKFHKRIFGQSQLQLDLCRVQSRDNKVMTHTHTKHTTT